MGTAMSRARKVEPSGSAGDRKDGVETRMRLLDVAGQVFAALGYAVATSKMICERAGVNLAAVNYHFGGKQGLYQAVLAEAHRRMMSVEQLHQFAALSASPRVRLEIVVEEFVRHAAGGAGSWPVRLLVHELISPSSPGSEFSASTVEPKRAVVQGLLAQVLNLPENDPAVQRAMAFTFMSCMALLAALPEVEDKYLPNLKQDTESLGKELVEFVLAGLDALARKHAAIPGGPHAHA